MVVGFTFSTAVLWRKPFPGTSWLSGFVKLYAKVVSGKVSVSISDEMLTFSSRCGFVCTKIQLHRGIQLAAWIVSIRRSYNMETRITYISMCYKKKIESWQYKFSWTFLHLLFLIIISLFPRVLLFLLIFLSLPFLFEIYYLV